MRPLSLYLLSFFIIIASPSLFGHSLEGTVSAAYEGYHNCVDSLPAEARQVFSPSSNSQTLKLSKGVRERLRNCIDQKQKYEALKDISSLKSDLVGLHDSQNSSMASVLEEEALEIASTLVETTALLNKEYQMARSVLWHNFLIKIGAKKGGYCYQWTENLLTNLPSKKFQYFERHWGVHNDRKATENNAVIITRRGDPINKGIVYDAWRGKGYPYWRQVSKDTQDWTELFTEGDILAGRM